MKAKKYLKENRFGKFRHDRDERMYYEKDVIKLMEDYSKQFSLTNVSQQRELLKALIGKEVNATLLNGKKCRVLKSVEESFLIKENHNDKIRWVGISEIDIKSL